MLDVIVIGGGPSGVTAALRARELGAQVTLVERERLGGTCTNDGCAPTRVLAKAARLARGAKHFSEYGLYANEPEIDFAQVLANAQQKVYRLHEKKQLLGHFQQAGIRVLENVGNVQFVDAQTIQLSDGARFHADRFIICAGGHAKRLNIPGGEHALTQSSLVDEKITGVDGRHRRRGDRLSARIDSSGVWHARADSRIPRANSRHGR